MQFSFLEPSSSFLRHVSKSSSFLLLFFIFFFSFSLPFFLISSLFYILSFSIPFYFFSFFPFSSFFFSFSFPPFLFSFFHFSLFSFSLIYSFFLFSSFHFPWLGGPLSLNLFIKCCCMANFTWSWTIKPSTEGLTNIWCWKRQISKPSLGRGCLSITDRGCGTPCR